jgi:predicted Zn-dependent peptidase
MFQKVHLDNGMTVVMERMGNMRSVSAGIWVKVGSRREAPERNGISHFLEHMFFKGTKERSSLDIAFEIDSLGGDLNAFTSKEGTTFYVKVLDDYLERGIVLLADIFMNSLFPEEEIEKEKGVIQEEIRMVEDTPDDHVHDIFSQTVWGPDGLGQTVLGTLDTVRSFSREDLLNHVRSHYGIEDTIVSVAGNFNPEAVITLLNRTVGTLARGSESFREKVPCFRPQTSIITKDLSEIHMCYGLEGIAQSSKDRYAILLLNTILGGGVSSRLFQEIREKRGLAYSVYSFLSSYQDTGIWAVYAGTSAKRFNEVLEMIVKEFAGLPENLTEPELERARAQIKGSLLLSLESTTRRMQNIATQQIYLESYMSPREIIREIDAVSLHSVKELAEKLLSREGPALTLLGPVEKSDLETSTGVGRLLKKQS